VRVGTIRVAQLEMVVAAVVSVGRYIGVSHVDIIVVVIPVTGAPFGTGSIDDRLIPNFW